MDQTQKRPGGAPTPSKPHSQTTHRNSSRPLKIWRVLAALSTGRRWHRFRAERLLHDHCLHSTIAGIQKRYGLEIRRELIEVRGYQGAPTRVAEYWLEGAELEKAQQLIGTWREAA